MTQDNPKADTEVDTILGKLVRPVTSRELEEIRQAKAAIAAYVQSEVRRDRLQLQTDIKRLPTVDSGGWWVSKADINKLFAELEAGNGEAHHG